MSIVFDIESIDQTEFGVGLGPVHPHDLYTVPIEGSVKVVLESMLCNTLEALSNYSTEPERYQSSDRQVDIAHLYAPFSEGLTGSAQHYYSVENDAPLSDMFQFSSRIGFYFARFRDAQGRVLLAIRRAAQFKSLLRKPAILNIFGDRLRMVEGPVFQLDRDFDIVVTESGVHILRPRQFELICNLEEVIRLAVPQNISDIAEQLPWVDFGRIATYSANHVSAARLIASIRANGYSRAVSPQKLAIYCLKHGIEVKEDNNKLVVEDSHILKFLQLLDRRRFDIELVDGEVEYYHSPVRTRL